MVCHPSTVCSSCSQSIWPRRQSCLPRLLRSSTARCGIGRCQRRYQRRKGQLEAAPEAIVAPEEQTETSNDSKHPWEDYFSFEVEYAQDGPCPETIRHIIGMRHWRLNGMMSDIWEFLTAEMEGLWRQLLMDDLELSSLSRGKKFFDSLDSDGSKGEGFTRATENPEPIDEGYPRMFLESREYSSEVFRRLLVNTGTRQDGVEVMHVLMVPYPQYNIPIFYMEVIGVDENMTYCVLDLVPATMAQDLPDIYESGMQLLRKKMGGNNRDIPEWFQGVCSQNAFFMVPKDDSESAKCVACAGLLAKAYLKSAEGASYASDEQQMDIRKAHERFHQLASISSKTESIIQMSFTDASFLDMFYGDVLHDMLRNADENGYKARRTS